MEQRSDKIFVGGVHPDVTEEEFKEYFASFGNVRFVRCVVVFAGLNADRLTTGPRSDAHVR